MATIEQRVNVTLDANTLKAIKKTAEVLKTSVSKVCADLIKRRLEDDEDVYWANLVNDLGDISKKKRISLEEAKRHLDELPD